MAAWTPDLVTAGAFWIEPFQHLPLSLVFVNGDSEECDGELSSWGSTPCGGALLSSPFSSNIFSFAGRVLEEARTIAEAVTLFI